MTRWVLFPIGMFFLGYWGSFLVKHIMGRGKGV